MRRLAIAAGLLASVSGSAVAAEAVDLELVLAADGSGSIDDGEMRLQREGYAAAITDPEVLQAIQSGFTGRIAVAYVEWGSASSQHVIVDWHVIDGPNSAKVFASALVERPRAATGWNSISNAIAFSQRLMETNAFRGTRKVIDVSADSGNYGGVPLPVAREAAIQADITINGLAILCRTCDGRPTRVDLESYFEENVIGGFGAFVVTVDATHRFAEAVRKKLLLEIAGRMPDEDTPSG